MNRLLQPSLALLAAAAATAALPAQRQLREWFGPAQGSDYGTALASAPGGVASLLVIGAPGRDAPGLVDCGAGFLLDPATNLLLGAANGHLIGARMGTRVASAGDLDGNGTPDLILAGPLFAAQGGVVGHYSNTGALLWASFGASGRRFGSALCRVGDLDGDGFADLAIGSPGNATSSPFGLCATYRSLNAQVQFQVQGGNQTDVGAALVALGDVDGDGHVDVACGEPGYSGGSPGSGRIRLLRSNQSGSAAQIWSNGSFATSAGAGRSLGNAGDLDGDGVDDLLTPVDFGVVRLLSGATGTLLASIVDGDVDSTNPVAGIGDQNGDGVPEFAVGKPAYSSQRGRVTVYDGATRTVLFHLDGQAGSLFGQSLAALGDVDGDLRPDFAVGAPRHKIGSQQIGRVAVFGISIQPQAIEFGTSCSSSAGPLHMHPVGTPRPGQSFGVRVANLPAQSFGAWIFGESNTNSNLGPLPLDLGPLLGAVGCSLYTSDDVVFLFANGNDSYLGIMLNPPSVPSLAGAQLYCQAALLGSAYPGGGITSNGVALRLGSL